MSGLKAAVQEFKGAVIMTKLSRLAIKNEDGYVFVMTIMILAVLMLAGVLTSNSSITELSSVRNSIIHSQNTAAAESAAMVAVQLLENEFDSDNLVVDSSNSSNGTNSWIVGKNVATGWANTPKVSLVSRGETNKLQYRVVGWTVPTGSSIDMTKPSLKSCAVVGRYNSDKYGTVSIELGFLKKF